MERGAGNPLFLQELASVGETGRRGRGAARDRRGARRRPGSTSSHPAIVPCCAGRPCSASRSRARSSPRCSRTIRRSARRRRHGTDSASSSSVTRTFPAPSASATRSSATRPTKDSRTGDGASCTVASPRSSSVRQGDRPEEAAELLSLHYFNGGRWEKAFTYSRLAGDLAREVYANVDAARFYERAIEASAYVKSVDEIELATTWRSLGVVREAAGDYRGAIDALKLAARPVQARPRCRRRHLRGRALAWARLGSYSTALRDTTGGLDGVSTLATVEATRAACNLLALRAQIHIQQGRPRQAIESRPRSFASPSPSARAAPLPGRIPLSTADTSISASPRTLSTR